MCAWHPHCAGGIEVLLGSTFVKVAGPRSLPPFAARSAAGGAPSSLLWDCSARASDLPRRAPRDFPSPGSPAAAAPSRPATHASDSIRDDLRHRSERAASETRGDDTGCSGGRARSTFARFPRVGHHALTSCGILDYDITHKPVENLFCAPENRGLRVRGRPSASLCNSRNGCGKTIPRNDAATRKVLPKRPPARTRTRSGSSP